MCSAADRWRISRGCVHWERLGRKVYSWGGGGVGCDGYAGRAGSGMGSAAERVSSCGLRVCVGTAMLLTNMENACLVFAELLVRTGDDIVTAAAAAVLCAALTAAAAPACFVLLLKLLLRLQSVAYRHYLLLIASHKFLSRMVVADCLTCRLPPSSPWQPK